MKSTVEQYLLEIRNALQSIATDDKKQSIAYFFKHEIQCLGVSSPQTQQIGRRILQELKGEDKAFVYALAEKLFQTGFIEEALLAAQLVFSRKKEFETNDFVIFENWISKYVSNWAVCDTFCNQTIGTFIMTYPNFVLDVKQWSVNENLWMRRACAVSFIYPAKKELFIEDQLEIALALLEDNEDMVQKGYGWMLKVLSQRQTLLVFDFIEQYKSRMPRTALRYAIEKMPKNLRNQAMKKSFPVSL
jgi:3-methyladenine DNA glycosylase AlkD